jgi:IS4 transposase
LTAGYGITVRVVFVHNRNKDSKREWLALLSTNTNISEEEIIRIYGMRWDIEVYFKVCKSFLRLAKEFQGRSYDSMVSHTSVEPVYQ